MEVSNSYSFGEAMLLLFQWDSSLWEITLLSLRVSLSSLAIATLIGLPLGGIIAVKRFPAKQALLVVINSLMGLPPVVVGLFVYLALSRIGPFGVFGLLYSPTAMIIAQSLLIMPIIIALSRQHIEAEWRYLGPQLRSWRMNAQQALPTLFWETRVQLSTVILAGFGRAIAEIGAVMIVGGNIDHYTRVMTTAIALETSKGNLELALALGVVLLLVSLLVNALVHILGHWRKQQA